VEKTISFEGTISVANVFTFVQLGFGPPAIPPLSRAFFFFFLSFLATTGAGLSVPAQKGGGKGALAAEARKEDPLDGLAGCTANARPAVGCKAAVRGIRRGSHPSPKQELAFSMARVQM